MPGQLRRVPQFWRTGAPRAAGLGELAACDRDWEVAYRRRWHYDKVVRSTHGVNCTGSCSQKSFVKSRPVPWEKQQPDCLSNGPDRPEHEP